MKQHNGVKTIFLIVSILTIAAILSVYLVPFPGENPLKTDLTIYLKPPILGDGGTVTLLPKKIPVDEWKSEQPFGDNPALQDAELLRQHPLNPSDKRISVVINDSITMVHFNYPTGGTYNVHLRPANDIYPKPQLQTEEGSIGSGGYVDPVTKKQVLFETIQVIHVLGDRVDASDSRKVDNSLSNFYENGVDCSRFFGGKVCTPTEASRQREIDFYQKIEEQSKANK